METKLKPCPFCGGEAVLMVLDNGVSVKCWECRVSTVSKMDSTLLGKPTNAIKYVIEKWNRRVNDDT